MSKKTGISRCDRKFEFYLDWLKSQAVDYVVLDYHLNNFDDIKQCSSLLLTGGDDIFPEFYADWEDGKDRSNYKPERDGFEFRLLDYALANSMPVLGICRGMQLINCKLNGSLISDIKTVRNIEHRKISDTEDREHEVMLTEGTLVHNIIKEKHGTVNSSHHQGIDRLGEGLIVSARSHDCIIEAIEPDNKNSMPFIIGIQWHPERMKDLSSPFRTNVLKRFKKETLKSRQN